MAKLSCPACGRRLTTTSPDGPITCDGCDHRFHPANTVLQPAHPLKRTLGWISIVAGASLLLSSVQSSLQLDFQDRDTPITMGTMLLIPVAIIFAGINLKSSKLVERPGPETGS